MVEEFVVNLKAITDATDKELHQSINYLESTRQEIGLLMNFDAKSFWFNRIVNQKKDREHPVNPFKKSS